MKKADPVRGRLQIQGSGSQVLVAFAQIEDAVSDSLMQCDSVGIRDKAIDFLVIAHVSKVKSVCIIVPANLFDPVAHDEMGIAVFIVELECVMCFCHCSIYCLP